jgi:uncharacterized protein YifE (UPF0438 family)
MPEIYESKAFTPEEAQLLKEHMQFYRDLETGRRRPENEVQSHFVRMTLGHAVAQTPHEMAYAKYMRIRGRRKAASKSAPPRDPAEGPTEEWGTREEWKKMRGQEFRDRMNRARGR